MMSRQIKFRAWDLKTHRMLNHDYLLNYSLKNVIKAYKEGGRLMQFTGLRDSKRTEEYSEGQEIYEGDILRLWRSEGSKGQLRGEYGRPLPVEYSEQWCQFVVVDKQLKSQYGIWQSFQAFEIIGNIYENPELVTL